MLESFYRSKEVIVNEILPAVTLSAPRLVEEIRYAADGSGVTFVTSLSPFESLGIVVATVVSAAIGAYVYGKRRRFF